MGEKESHVIKQNANLKLEKSKFCAQDGKADLKALDSFINWYGHRSGVYRGPLYMHWLCTTLRTTISFPGKELDS